MARSENLRLDQLKDLLEQGKLDQARRAMSAMHPADAAQLMEDLPEEDRLVLFNALDARTASEVVVELSDRSRDQVLAAIDTQTISDIVDDLPSDEATDIIAELPQDQAQEVLSRIDLQDSHEVRTLLQYEEDSAGGLMQLELVAVGAGRTLSEVIEEIRSRGEELGELHYVYVVDDDNRILGYIPVTRLVLADPESKAGDVMLPCPLVVRADEDQETVAHKFRRYDVVAAPVVDEDGHLLGRITVDDVMEVIEEETREDLLRMAGSSSEEDMFQGQEIIRTARLRLPWLLSNMVGGLISGSLLWMFKVTLTDALYLIAFVPVINAMAGNVGLQSSTIMVRGFAVGRVSEENLGMLIWKELRVAMLIGVVCGVVVGLVANFWHHNPFLGVVVSLAMTSAITAAGMLGTLAPALLKKLGVDPAISSGPVVASLNDILGICIYFGIATLFYRFLVT